MELTTLLILLFILPQISMFVGAGSTSIASLIVLVFLNIMILIKLRNVYIYPLIYSCILIASGIMVAILSPDAENVYLAKVLMEVVFFSLLLLSCRLSISVDIERFKMLVYSLFTFTILSLFFSIGGEHFNMAVFPFIEPSHFSLFLGYLYFISKAIVPKMTRVIILNVLLLGLLYANLISLIFIVYVIFHYMIRKSWFLAIFPLILLIGVFIFFGEKILPDYLYQRMSLSESNLSSLVYLSGIENIINVFEYGKVFGFGFASLGYADVSNEYQVLIFELTGKNINITDGSFIFSKLAFQFGLISLVFLMLISYMYYKSFNSIYTNPVFAVVLMFPFEFFIRSPGIMSGGFILISMSCYKWYYEKNSS